MSVDSAYVSATVTPLAMPVWDVMLIASVMFTSVRVITPAEASNWTPMIGKQVRANRLKRCK